MLAATWPLIDSLNPSAEEIAAARADDGQDLPVPDADVQRADWVVVIGICTNLGCVLDGQARPPAAKWLRRWGGWFCPCCASHYDTVGRVRAGPAPRNLDIPLYRFLNDTTMVVG